MCIYFFLNNGKTDRDRIEIVIIYKHFDRRSLYMYKTLQSFEILAKYEKSLSHRG